MEALSWLWLTLMTDQVDVGRISSEMVKEQMVSYHIASVQTISEVNDLKMWLREDYEVRDPEGPFPSTSSPHPYFVIQFIEHEDHDRRMPWVYHSSKAPRRFLDYDVYLTTRVGQIHYHIFKLGVDDQLNVVRFNGFTHKKVINNAPNPFLPMNDILQFNRSDVPVYDRDLILEFLTDWIQLTHFRDWAHWFRILSNEYELTKGGIEGICHSVELDQGAYQESKVIYKKWEYRVPETGTPDLRLLSEIVDDDLSVFLGRDYLKKREEAEEDARERINIMMNKWRIKERIKNK